MWRSEPESTFKQHRMKTVALLPLKKKKNENNIYIYTLIYLSFISIQSFMYICTFKWTFVHFEGKVSDFLRVSNFFYLVDCCSIDSLP